MYVYSSIYFSIFVSNYFSIYLLMHIQNNHEMKLVSLNLINIPHVNLTLYRFHVNIHIFSLYMGVCFCVAVVHFDLSVL